MAMEMFSVTRKDIWKKKRKHVLDACRKNSSLVGGIRSGEMPSRERVEYLLQLHQAPTLTSEGFMWP